MFDIGWTEMLVIAVVMIVVVGPKDLPRMLRTFGRTTTKLRAMAGDFQKQFNEALKEAELDDVKKSVDQLRSLNPASEIRKQLNPFEKAAADIRSGLDSLKTAPAAPATTASPANPAEPASPVAHAAEPLKNGAAGLVGVSGPEAMPATPVFPAANATPADPVIAAAAPPSAATAASESGTPVKSSKPAAAKARQPRRKRRRSRRPGWLPRNRPMQVQGAATGRRTPGQGRGGQNGRSQTGGEG